jgi:hypothetical protein
VDFDWTHADLVEVARCWQGGREERAFRRLRPVVMQSPAEDAAPPPAGTTKATKPKRPRLDWATLHRRTFGTDVLRYPCGGRRTVRRLNLGRKQAEARLAELGHPLPSRLLPPETAPPQLVLDVA